jgi:glycosyltransferase involved in cell wall biosynthesis
MNNISVVIITHNEENNIARCLESVKWANEIIIVDSGSTDNTINIAKSYGAIVYSQKWLGFGPQKNLAISKSSYQWILAVDADEVISNELSESISNAVKSDVSACYAFKRVSQFCGKWIKHGDWRNDLIIRLFRKDLAQYSNDIVHEKVVHKCEVEIISGIMWHYSQDYITLSLKKMNDYSDSTSLMLFRKGKRCTILKAIFHKNWAFFRGFIMKRGFLDGQHGYLIAKLTSYGSYFKYIKLWELEYKRNIGQSKED